MKALVRNSADKTIHRRGSGHSANRRTLKIAIFCAHPLPKSPLLVSGTSQRGGNGTGGMRHLCGKRLRTRAPHMPSLKPLSLLCQNEGSMRHQRVICVSQRKIIDPLMGLFRGAVFHLTGVPENCPLALMGRFPSLMGRFLSLMGRFHKCLNGPFSILKLPHKTAH